MPMTFDDKLVVAISSRALFDMDESHRIFEEQGIKAYCEYQIDHEDEVLAPGVAYPLVHKLLALNGSSTGVEVILLSRNSADTGLRIFNSIQHYELGITRAAFTNGERPWRYIPAFGAHLFLSADPNDVVQALSQGYAAATILPSAGHDPGKAAIANGQGTNGQGANGQGANGPGVQDKPGQDQLRIAFDGDAVLFSDTAERVFRSEGLEGFSASERAQARDPLPGGPFKAFLSALHTLQKVHPVNDGPIRTALVTARSAPAHERVIRTLRHWNIRIDEALFLGGLSKVDFLQAFGADIFFDDQEGHCQTASRLIATGHVPHGVANEAVAATAQPAGAETAAKAGP